MPCTLEIIDITPTALSRSTDANLLHLYSERLAADHVPWRKREFLLRTATQFLQWWRKNFGGEEFQVVPVADNWPKHESAWWEVRESYLRHACPDHDLRSEERTNLNCFLRFIAALKD